MGGVGAKIGLSSFLYSFPQLGGYPVSFQSKRNKGVRVQ